MFASWDCKHYLWKACPVRLQGMHKGKEGKSIILEAIADPYMYIWYCFFGEPGSLNDINVLDKSSILGALISGKFDVKVEDYCINNTIRDWLYFLVDGIYPEYALFVKTISVPTTNAKEKYSKKHEHRRKDVERAFGVMNKQHGILERPLRNWYLKDIRNILHTCIIIHNMITVVRKENYSFSDLLEEEEEEELEEDDETISISIFNFEEGEYNEFLQQELSHRVAHMMGEIEDTEKHMHLLNDLKQHINNKY